MTWNIEQVSSNVHIMRFEDIYAGWEQKILLRSDAHHDNVKNDWKLEQSHLIKAKDCNAPILDFGDCFCAMQGKYDPRKDLNQLKEEHRRIDYLDALVETAANDYAPFANQFAMMGLGNHEWSILDRLGTNLVGNLVHRLNTIAGKRQPTYASGIGGWIIFRFNIRKNHRQSLSLYFFHGAGGGGPVTRGVIQTNRMAVYLPDADIVVTGHTHDTWVVPIERHRITQLGKTYSDHQYHVRTGTYKNDFGDGSGNWHVVTGKPPKPMGAVWMILRYENDKIVPKFEIDLK